MSTTDGWEKRQLPHYYEIRRLLGQFARFVHGVETVYETVVLPAKVDPHDPNPYAFMLRAYLMQCFAWIDWCSAFHAGTGDKQTNQMAAFLRRYIRRADRLGSPFNLHVRRRQIIATPWRYTSAVEHASRLRFGLCAKRVEGQ